MSDYHKLSDEEFAAACDAYRAMMRANEGKSHKEQLEAINRFRCGNYKETTNG